MLIPNYWGTFAPKGHIFEIKECEEKNTCFRVPHVTLPGVLLFLPKHGLGEGYELVKEEAPSTEGSES